MKLISCHIENFGRLNNLDLEFHDGLNPILRENGWGKSTFAHFLLVMFYGFANERKKNDLENERRRFAPWQNGVYGGSITFIWRDRKYRLERTFGPRDGKEDALAQYDADTGLVCRDFSAVPGEDIFSLDRPSFERTIFIGQQSVHTDVTAGIHAKIGDLTGEQADMSMYDEVQKRLKTETDRLTPSRKTGEIHQLKTHLAELSATISGKSGEEAAYHQNNLRIASLQEEKRDLLSELEQLQNDQRALSRDKDLGARREIYENFRREEAAALKDRDDMRNQFPDEVPDPADVDEWLETASSLDRVTASDPNDDLSPEQQQEYIHLRSTFRNEVPGESAIARAEELNRNLQIAVHRASRSRLSPEEEKKRQEDADFFSSYLPESVELSEAIRSWNRRNAIVSALPQKKANARLLKNMLDRNSGEESPRRPAHSFAGIFLIFCGIAMIAAGFFISRSPSGGFGIPVVALMGAGILSLLIGSGLEFVNGGGGRSKGRPARQTATDSDDTASSASPSVSSGAQHSSLTESSEEELRQLSYEIRADEAEIDEIEQTTRAVFDRIGIDVPPEDTYQTLYDLRGKVREYQELERRDERFRSGEENRNIKEMEDQLYQFLTAFYPALDEDTDMSQSLQELKYDVRRYREFLDRREKQRLADDRRSRKENDLREYLRSIGYLPERDMAKQLNRIRDQLRRLSSLEEIYQNRKAAREQFEDRHNMGQILAGASGTGASYTSGRQGQTLEAISARQEEIHERISDLEAKIQSCQRDSERINGRLEEIADAENAHDLGEQKLKKLEHRYQVLMATRRYLEEARARFSAKFMEPVRKEYMKYYQLLSPGDGKEYTLDADLNIRVREAGASRDVGYLSEGYQDLIGLCRRMAMIDIMYRNEKPFLLFDDPFVNLDDQKLTGARDFLTRIAENYQIIYLTCQNARNYSETIRP